MLSNKHFTQTFLRPPCAFFSGSAKKRLPAVISLKLCRNSLIRLFVALVIISSLLNNPAYSQESEDSRTFISGFNAFQQQDYVTTITSMNEVLQKYPDSPLRDMALFWLSRAYFKNGNQLDAARSMSQFSKEYPDNPLKGTADEELLALTARYEKGEQLPVGTLPVVAQKEDQEQARAAAVKAAEERKAAEQKAASEKVDMEQVAREQAEMVRLAQEKAEQKRLAVLKAEEERQAAEKAAKDEQKRVAAAKAEEERVAAEAEKKRLAAIKAEADRVAAEHAERLRLEREKVEQGRRAAAVESARLAAIQKEQERAAAEKAAAERLAQEKLAVTRRAAEEAEQKKQAMLIAEQERVTAQRIEKERQAVAAADMDQQRAALRPGQAQQAVAKAEEPRQNRARTASKKGRTSKAALREKAIAQYKSILEKYPSSKAAATAAAKLKALGVAVALPQAAAAGPLPENAQILRFEVAQFAGLEFNLPSKPRAYTVSQRFSIPFEVTNRGNGSDSFYLESGFPAEFAASFAGAAQPEQAVNQTTALAPGESFKGVINLVIPPATIDGQRISYPVKAASRLLSEATQSREVTITAAAPLLRALVKTDTLQPAPGEKTAYRVTVLNVGSTAAQGVTLRLNFPPQLEPLDYAAAGFRLEMKAALVLDGLQLKPGESRDFTLPFQLKEDSLAGQELLTRAELVNIPLKTAAVFISNAAHVHSQHGVVIRTVSERQVVIPGQALFVAFIVTNTGNVRDTFRLAPTVKGAQEPVVFRDLNRDGTRQANEPLVTEVGPLAPKEEASIVMEIKTPRSADDGSQGSAQIVFSSDADASRSSSGTVQFVYSRPVLQMAMTGRDGRLKPGEVASFDLTITNRGSNLARVVELQGAWPEQLELIAADPSSSSAGKGKILWNFKEVGAGEKRTIKVSFRVKPGIEVGTNIQVKNLLSYEDQLGNRY